MSLRRIVAVAALRSEGALVRRETYPLSNTVLSVGRRSRFEVLASSLTLADGPA